MFKKRENIFEVEEGKFLSPKFDANGLIQVKAVDKATNKEQSIRIEASSGLTEEEIEKMGFSVGLRHYYDGKNLKKVFPLPIHQEMDSLFLINVIKNL